MNERIKQLAEQAGQLQLATPDNPSADAIMVLIGPNIEKFAELIVKECADFLTDDLDYPDAALKLKERFGVEE